MYHVAMMLGLRHWWNLALLPRAQATPDQNRKIHRADARLRLMKAWDLLMKDVLSLERMIHPTAGPEILPGSLMVLLTAQLLPLMMVDLMVPRMKMVAE